MSIVSGPSKFVAEVKINATWDEDLSSAETSKYRQLKSTFEQQVITLITYLYYTYYLLILHLQDIMLSLFVLVGVIIWKQFGQQVRIFIMLHIYPAFNFVKPIIKNIAFKCIDYKTIKYFQAWMLFSNQVLFLKDHIQSIDVLSFK